MRFHKVLMFAIITCTIAGCQGTGQMVNFDPTAMPTRTKVAEPYHDDTLRIAVSPFEDLRKNQANIGKRTHFWGGTTQFNAWDGHVGEGMADLAVSYLQQRQWQAARETGENLSDVILSGQVLKLESQAKSGFGFTDIQVGMQVRFEAKNMSDGSTVRTILGSNGSDTVVFFDPDDVKTLMDEVAKELFDQLFRDLTVRDRAFHLRSNTQ
ncbi:MAG: hypothetical protein MRJ96_13360 [Nitrospirales bacterium]|nr:hypothetical protein [Nitrospira sp.]MDR4502432.1 hypothetical protein [Nitrospirales bacterium]